LPLFKKNRHKPGKRKPAPVPDWRDLTILLCAGLVVLGAIALATAAQTFSLVEGRIVEKGVGLLKFGNKTRITNTISVLIENDDRVFAVKRGTIVKYPVSDNDAKEIEIGSRVHMYVSSYNPTVQILAR
jgi:hypothetical protein